MNADTGSRGEFAGESTFTSLRFNLREDLITEVSSQDTDAPKQITDIGIELADNGTLTLEDADALIAAIEENPEAVQTLFSASDGIATRLSDRIQSFFGVGGLIDDRQDNIDTRIRGIDQRLVRFDDAIGRREEQLRGEFARLQQSIELLQSQQFSLSAF